MIFILTFFGLLSNTAWAHGRLTQPLPRIGDTTSYEHNPTGFQGKPASEFICRHASPNPSVTPLEVSAGQTLQVRWQLNAAHVGDCAFFLSYDVDKPLEQMEFFKIGNLERCREYDELDVPVVLPNWLPEGRAVFRWEWYAIHLYPSVEFYVQCADINITPTSDAVDFSEISTYKVFENGVKLSLPEGGDVAPGFRDPYIGSNGLGPQFVTGTACARGSTLNNCALTAPGTMGHVSVNGSPATPVTQPTTQPPSATQPPALPTADPTDAYYPPTYPSEDPVADPTTYTPPIYPSEEPAADPTEATAPAPTYGPDAPYCNWGPMGDAASSTCDGSAQGGIWCNANRSQCEDGCQGRWCDPTNPVPTPTAPNSSDEEDSEVENCPNAEWATCGGELQIDALTLEPVETCCQHGLTCVFFNKWYSQCLKA